MRLRQIVDKHAGGATFVVKSINAAIRFLPDGVPDLQVYFKHRVLLFSLTCHSFRHFLVVLCLRFRLVLLENVFTVSIDARSLANVLVSDHNYFSFRFVETTDVGTLLAHLASYVLLEESFCEGVWFL